MTDYVLFASASAIISGGKASIRLGPQLAREQWDIDTTTVTSLNLTVTVAQDAQTIDSTQNDPRPTATDNTPFHLMTGHAVTATWLANATTGNVDGTSVTLTVKGKRRIGDSSTRMGAQQ